MSMQSSTYRNIIQLEVVTNYDDDGGLKRSQRLECRFLQWEVSISLDKGSLLRFHRRFLFHYMGKFDPVDNEGLYHRYEEKRARNAK